MKKIRVMIVEDSAVTRELLRHIVGRDPRLEVAAAVESAEEALRILENVSPDVISMDIRLPGMDGMEATKLIMTQRPTPIVVIAASVVSEDLNISINALRAGALSVMEKPVGVTNADYDSVAERICTQLAIMSQVKLVRQRPMKEYARPAVQSAAATGSGSKITRAVNSRMKMLGIVASTGGPSAVLNLLCGLGGQFPLPILVVQHITSGFLEGFVAWLATNCPLKVVAARGGEVPMPGTVYVAPSERHLCIEGAQLKLTATPPVSFQRPSGTVLLQSMASNLGRRGMGVVLTGMGDDGAQGLLEMRQAGGYTFAEDESTAVVYGMPAVAFQLGAVCESLPLTMIAARISEKVLAETEPNP